MKQTGNFRYAEGPRKAQADAATLEQEKNVMTLETHARISDESGSTAGDHIDLQQDSGDFDARGHVSTTRLPDAKKTSSDMLDKDEPTQGMADRVTSGNQKSPDPLRWKRGALAVFEPHSGGQDRRGPRQEIAGGRWQGGLAVSGRQEGDKKGKPAATQPVFTIVKAQHMVYTDADRQAVYTGGANLWRPSLTVKSATLKAFLNDNKTDSDSRINHAFADGKVEIVDTTPVRKRIGTSEHAEYYD